MAGLSSTVVPLLLILVVLLLAVTSPPSQAHASRLHQVVDVVADPPLSSSSSSVETDDKVGAGTDVLIIHTSKREHVAEDGHSDHFSLQAPTPSAAPEGGGLDGDLGGFFAELRRKFWRYDEPYVPPHVISGHRARRI